MKSRSLLLNISASCISSSPKLFGTEGGDTVSQILPNTPHQSPIEYDNLHLPSFLEGKERIPFCSKNMRNAGCRSFVTSLRSQGTRELGNQGTRLLSPGAECRGRKGNQCIGGRRGLLETQRLIRVRGNSRGKTDQQTLSNA